MLSSGLPESTLPLGDATACHRQSFARFSSMPFVAPNQSMLEDRGPPPDIPNTAAFFGRCIIYVTLSEVFQVFQRFCLMLAISDRIDHAHPIALGARQTFAEGMSEPFPLPPGAGQGEGHTPAAAPMLRPHPTPPPG
jgi:hypothetical protein